MNNNVMITGVVSKNFEFDHEAYGEKFYKVIVDVARTSGAVDSIPVILSEILIDTEHDYSGQFVSVNGEYRSYNDKGHTILFVFAKSFTLEEIEIPVNSIKITGFICKAPKYRETPLGREICDLMVAVNRQYGKSDYIPGITWGRNAKRADLLEVGDKVEVDGRIQSREYEKKFADGSCETRVAYEVSASKVEKVEVSDEE